MDREAIERLAEVRPEPNRYLLARIPVSEGALVRQAAHPDAPDHNELIDALRDDKHLGAFLSFALPNKENGFDIEGLAAAGNRLFLGLRGPVLRGWAIILEIEVEELTPGVLNLKPVGPDGQRYKKHFVHLNGLGIQELCLHYNSLLILAGPTMDLPGVVVMK